MVGVAQLVEHLVVSQDGAGSNPVAHPNARLAERQTRAVQSRVL